ncbi:MAG: thiamine pyrophosphate-dependent dehydrogenase E1 component subunit alpha [bacterium]|nr:thiamine pyrophosphate-dependent dehydrogenase E1 component subunit alpha [Planctomycetota bacterium]HIL51043.1 thiamine pyrophosphate-dependent dehydrogenase E1 component subunit alpha [Planctomycetota bacterium]
MNISTNDPFQILAPDGSVVGDLPQLSEAELVDILRGMLRVRCIDDRMLKLQRAGRIGFVGSAMGQEATMIGSAVALLPQDWLWSGLREGGAAIMRGLPLDEYVAQMFCNANDTAKGRQMCNHFQHKGSHYPSWSSVIGTQIPHGVGAAFAARQRGLDEVHVIFFGDGASSSNGFHSGLNFAGVWKAPCVFVLVHNGWAISVSSRNQTAANSYSAKGTAYGVEGREVDGNCALACYQALKEATDSARRGAGPQLVVLNTYRMGGHSSSDDPSKYRDEAEVDEWRDKDPIERMTRFLEARGSLAAGAVDELRDELFMELDTVIRTQEAAPRMSWRTLVEDVYADVPPHLRQQYNQFLITQEKYGEASPSDGAFPL